MSGGVEPETPPGSAGGGSPMARKPPRHQLTSIRHCSSSARIAAASTDLVTTLNIPSSSLPSHFLKLPWCLSFLFLAGAGIGDLELDIAHRHPSRLPADLPVWELRQYWAEIVYGGRACLHRQPHRAPRNAYSWYPCPGCLLRGELDCSCHKFCSCGSSIMFLSH
jgi:hypothetical protein